MTTAWDRVTTRAGWTVLVVFTALSSFLNARRVGLDGTADTELVAFHAAVPLVVLIVGVFAELVAMSSASRTAKAVTVTGLVTVFGITLTASYLAVLDVVRVWNPHAPTWVNAGLAAVPDIVMVMAGSTILALRIDRHRAGTVTHKPQAGRLRRLADAATARAEAALAVSANASADTSVDTSGDASVDVPETVTDPAVDTPAKSTRTVRKPAAKAPAKPAVDPSLEPFMDTAERLADARLIRGKDAGDYAKILRALDQGWSPSRIRDKLAYSHETTHKVAEAAAAPALAAVR